MKRPRHTVGQVMSTKEYRDLLNAEMSEAALQDEVRATALALGYLFYHTYDSRRSDEDFPDCVIVTPFDAAIPRDGRRLIFAELKRQNEVARDGQIRWLQAVGGAGAEHYIWRPADLPQVREILERKPR